MKYLWAMIIFPVSLVIFMILEYGRITIVGSEIIQPLIFTLVVEVIYLRKYRLPILLFSLAMLFLMVILYLFNYLLTANWIGSLGFGMLLLIISSYLPEFIKNGFIEKF